MIAGVAQTIVNTTANQKNSVAAGTGYSLTNSAAALDFATTDPSITLDLAGTYLILARAKADYNGATFAASRTVTLKLRRTNNTAADLTNGTITAATEIVTTVTSTFLDASWWTIYTTTNTDDVITLFGSVGTVPSAGSLDVNEAQITAIRLQQ